jgi:hypothetical protein
VKAIRVMPRDHEPRARGSPWMPIVCVAVASCTTNAGLVLDSRASYDASCAISAGDASDAGPAWDVGVSSDDGGEAAPASLDAVTDTEDATVDIDASAPSAGETPLDGAPEAIGDSMPEADREMDGNTATPDAADSGPSTLDILGSQSPWMDGGSACLDCARSGRCLDPNLLCEHLAGSVILDGPAAGQSRDDVCRATLTCLLGSQCMVHTGTLDGCYCGSVDDGSCADAGPTGDPPCLAIEQGGLETTNAAQALQTLTYTTLAAGTANALLQCLRSSGCVDCLL